MEGPGGIIVATWAPVVPTNITLIVGGQAKLLPACAFLDAVQRGCTVLPRVPRVPRVPLGILQLLQIHVFRLVLWNDHVDTLQALLAVYGTCWDANWPLGDVPPLHYEVPDFGLLVVRHRGALLQLHFAVSRGTAAALWLRGGGMGCTKRDVTRAPALDVRVSVMIVTPSRICVNASERRGTFTVPGTNN